MSKDKLQLLSPLFLKYQSDFEKNPRSRVFAPLAETYRKIGMTDKAMEILSQGIRFHPTYVMGYLGLAFCYFDLKQFNLAYTTLRPLIDSNRDNLRLQKIFAETCLELGKDEEALETFKYLLFINPRDKEVAEQVSRLEKKIEDRYRPIHKPIIIPESELFSTKNNSKHTALDTGLFDVSKLQSDQTNDFDDWMTVDLHKDQRASTEQQPPAQGTKNTDYDQWNVKKSDQVHSAPPDKNRSALKSVPTPQENFRTYEVHLDLDEDHLLDEEITEQPEQNKSEVPLVTHTLVDLYCGQGHIEKALEVLEKILILNPNDQKTIKKIKEIKELMAPMAEIESEEESLGPAEDESNFDPSQFSTSIPASNHLVDLDELDGVSEEDGRRHLMSLIDEKIGPIELEETTPESIHSVEKVKVVQEKLQLFLKRIQKRALDYQGRVC